VNPGSGTHWVFTGDTGPNPALWTRLAALKLSDLVIECAFANDECELAGISQHHCPCTLGDELAKLKAPVRVHITHIKPGERAAVMAAIDSLQTEHRITALEHFQEFALA